MGREAEVSTGHSSPPDRSGVWVIAPIEHPRLLGPLSVPGLRMGRATMVFIPAPTCPRPGRPAVPLRYLCRYCMLCTTLSVPSPRSPVLPHQAENEEGR